MFLLHFQNPFWVDFGFSTFFFLGRAFPPSLPLSGEVASLQAQVAQGAFGPLKKSLRSGIHARNPPKWSATAFISCLEPPKMGGEAAHLGLFRA